MCGGSCRSAEIWWKAPPASLPPAGAKPPAYRRGPEIEAILQRVENVYEQAVDRYNDTLSKPWVRLPAAVMGFCPIEPGKEA